MISLLQCDQIIHILLYNCNNVLISELLRVSGRTGVLELSKLQIINKYEYLSIDGWRCSCESRSGRQQHDFISRM